MQKMYNRIMKLQKSSQKSFAPENPEKSFSLTIIV